MIEHEVEFYEFNQEKINKSKGVPPLMVSDPYGFKQYRVEDPGKFRLIGNLKIFHLDFFSDDPIDQHQGESWADPLRALTLERLIYDELVWYISFIGDIPDATNPVKFSSIHQDFLNWFLPTNTLDYIELDTLESGNSRQRRIFIEAPREAVTKIVLRYWPRTYPAFPIQGLQMPAGQKELLRSWNDRTADQELFREIMDTVHLMFYTYPSENRHFVFLTNKLSFDEMSHILDIKDLRERAALFNK